MPIPKPKSGEKQDAFISRCMSAIGGEYDDNKQAVAICYDAWRKSKEKKESTMEIEVRQYPITEIRVQRDSGKPAQIIGYAAVFNAPSEDLGGFREYIAPGAFSRTLKEGADVRALYNHDPNYVLGRTKSGTLELSEDKKGLRIANTPPDTQWARDLTVSIERGDVDQMSFGFIARKDQWEEGEGEGGSKKVTRTLLDVDLVDVSPVTFPAYPDTTVAVRSMDAWKTATATANDLPEEPTLDSDPATPVEPTFKLVHRLRKWNLQNRNL